MVLETMASLSVVDKIVALASYTSPVHGIGFLTPYLTCSKLHFGVYAWQAVSYLLSPWFLRLEDRACEDSEARSVEIAWDNARPLVCIPTGEFLGRY